MQQRIEMADKKRDGSSEALKQNSDCQYMIVRPENGRLVDIFRLLLSAEWGVPAAGFLETSDQRVGRIGGDHRWIIVVSIIIRRIIAAFRKPMEWTGILVEFVLNLLSENDGVTGLVLNLLKDLRVRLDVELKRRAMSAPPTIRIPGHNGKHPAARAAIKATPRHSSKA
ncbi:hypothetical protein ACLOJK_000901 [Asimina triloba]